MVKKLTIAEVNSLAASIIQSIEESKGKLLKEFFNSPQYLATLSRICKKAKADNDKLKKILESPHNTIKLSTYYSKYIIANKEYSIYITDICNFKIDKIELSLAKTVTEVLDGKLKNIDIIELSTLRDQITLRNVNYATFDIVKYAANVHNEYYKKLEKEVLLLLSNL